MTRGQSKADERCCALEALLHLPRNDAHDDDDDAVHDDDDAQ